MDVLRDRDINQLLFENLVQRPDIVRIFCPTEVTQYRPSDPHTEVNRVIGAVSYLFRHYMYLPTTEMIGTELRQFFSEMAQVIRDRISGQFVHVDPSTLLPPPQRQEASAAYTAPPALDSTTRIGDLTRNHTVISLQIVRRAGQSIFPTLRSDSWYPLGYKCLPSVTYLLPVLGTGHPVLHWMIVKMMHKLMPQEEDLLHSEGSCPPCDMARAVSSRSNGPPVPMSSFVRTIIELGHFTFHNGDAACKIAIAEAVKEHGICQHHPAIKHAQTILDGTSTALIVKICECNTR
jgi:hypothetical protein